MGRPKLPDRVSLTLRISPKISEKIDTALQDLQESGESSLSKNGFVERLLISALQQYEAEQQHQKSTRLSA